MSKYRTQYRDADVVLFQPEADDTEIFFTRIFSYASRARVCEHAYERTRRDLVRRRAELEPIFARHGIRMRHTVLAAAGRGLRMRRRPEPPRRRLYATALELREALVDLRRQVARM